MSAHLRRFIFILAPACVAIGCSHARSEVLSFQPAPAQPTAAGIVKIRPQSRQFVGVAAVGNDEAAALVRSPGRVAFRDGAVARVGAPVHGRVASVSVHVGDHVHRGDKLLTLTSPDAATMQADLQRSEVAERAAAAEVERQSNMVDHGVGIQSDLIAARARLDEAHAELARARSNATFLGKGSNGSNGSVEVHAPIDGDVLALNATLGATAQPDGEELVDLGDPSDLWMVSEVFERELPLVRVGDTAMAEVASLAAPVKLQVVSVGAVVDPTTRRAPVYLKFVDDGKSLRAGMYARITLRSSAEGSVAVPAEAVLVKDGGRTIVYVAKDQDTFSAREVSIGHPVDGRVPVLGGLRPGERVAVRGALLLDSAAEQLL